jgi:hypothetical protein
MHAGTRQVLLLFKKGALGIFGQSGQAEPKHIHWGRTLYRHETGLLPNPRETTVGTNREQRPHFVPALRALVTNAVNLAPFLN